MATPYLNMNGVLAAIGRLVPEAISRLSVKLGEERGGNNQAQVQERERRRTE